MQNENSDAPLDGSTTHLPDEAAAVAPPQSEDVATEPTLSFLQPAAEPDPEPTLIVAAPASADAPPAAELLAPPTAVAAQPPAQPARPRDLGRYAPWLLLPILLLAAWFRFTGLNWDQFTHLHPDERFLTIVATKLRATYNPLTYLRTSESPLNPYNVGEPFFVYGNFPMTVVRVTAEWTQAFCDTRPNGCTVFGRLTDFTGYDGIHFVGRFLSGLLDLVSIGFIFLIGRRLYDWRVGLLAALLLALSVMAIQQSHFFTVDNWAAALCTIAFYWAVRAAGELRARWYVLFGVFTGLAMASRINVAPVALLSGVSGAIWLSRRVTRWGDLLRKPGADWAAAVVACGALAALSAALTFRVAMPYAFADRMIARETVRQQIQERTGQITPLEAVSPNQPGVLLRSVFGFNPRWLSNMEEIQRLQKPDAVFPPALQWTNRAPLLMPWTNMVLYGMGVTAGLAAWLGLGWAAWRIGRARPDQMAHLLPVLWALGYFVFIGIRWVKSVRYFLPIYPTLLLLAAWALVALWQHAAQAPSPARRRLRRLTAGAALALVVVPTLLWAVAFTRGVYGATLFGRADGREPFTRLAATEWMLENIPSGATLFYEVDGASRAMQLPLRNHLFQVGGAPLNLPFSLPEDGLLVAVCFNYLTDEQTNADPLRLRLSVVNAADGRELVNLEGGLQPPAPRSAATLGLGRTPAPGGAPLWLTADMTSGGIVIADTTIILNESWDDPLPTRTATADPFGQYVSGLRDDILGFDGQAPLPNPDDAFKRDGFYRWLDTADVIAISSQRALWSTPRLPLTYPLTTRYYEALFNGELGFELTAQFHADLRIGPLTISDTGGKLGWRALPTIGWPPPSDFWSAEEAFSVYDHPPVWIFTKRADYDPQQVRAVLGAVDLERTMFMNPGQATAAPTGLLFSAADFARQTAGGAFRDLFPPDGALNRSPALAAVVWWAAVVALGWLTFPIAFVALPALPGRGYPLARILGLLIVSWFGWLTASTGLLFNTRNTYWLGVALLALLSVACLWRAAPAIVAFVRRNGRYILIVEGIGVLLYLLAIGIRLGNPDVWDVIWGGEKPMDLTYFTAVLKSTTFPPYDPWYAGGMLNYYYYGFVYVGALTKLLGVAPAIAYNLAIPLLFSFTGLAAFGVAHDLTAWSRRSAAPPTGGPRLTARAPLLAGGIALLLTVIVGNLAQIAVILRAWRLAGDPALAERIPLFGGLAQALDGAVKLIGPPRAPIYPGDWFWSASRAIRVPDGMVEPITEFPFFTFLYGDLHAHMIALPLTLLALGWVIALGLRPLEQPLSRPAALLSWGIGALAIGALFPTNSWDFPTYVVLGALGVTLYQLRRHGRVTVAMLTQVVAQTVLLGGLAYLLFWPFHAHFAAGYSAIALWKEARTGLGSYLGVYGLFLLITLVHLAREFRAWFSQLSVDALAQLASFGPLLAVAAGGLVLLLGVLSWWSQFPILPLVAPIVLVAGLLALSSRLPVPRRIVLALIASAYALTLFVDLFVIEGTVGRMNTVFKFYMQVWVLLSVVGGVAVAAVAEMLPLWGPTRRAAWRGGFALLLAGALLYPPLATGAKWEIRMSPSAPRTLDGMAFMPYTSYQEGGQVVELAADYAALRWMQQHIDGSPVVAEATSDNYYRSIGSRVAMYTGLPTIIGWSGHQRQQRNALPNNGVDERINAVRQLYAGTDVYRALEIIDRYNVSYIYVGALERLYYDAAGIAKFGEMAQAGLLEPVYDAAGVQIYRVVRGEPAG